VSYDPLPATPFRTDFAGISARKLAAQTAARRDSKITRVTRVFFEKTHGNEDEGFEFRKKVIIFVAVMSVIVRDKRLTHVDKTLTEHLSFFR